MKRIIVLLTILALLLAGCCTKTDDAGVVTKNFANCLVTVQTIACNPPVAVTAVIVGIVELTKFAVGTLVPGTTEYLAAVEASAAATAISAGVCISVAQLNSLIAWVQNAEAKEAQVKMMVRAGPAKAKAVQVAPLQEWADKFK